MTSAATPSRTDATAAQAVPRRSTARTKCSIWPSTNDAGRFPGPRGVTLALLHLQQQIEEFLRHRRLGGEFLVRVFLGEGDPVAVLGLGHRVHLAAGFPIGFLHLFDSFLLHPEEEF